MSYATLLRTLHAQDVHLTVNNGELTIDAPEEFFSATMLQTLTAHKPALVALLTGVYPPARPSAEPPAPCVHPYSTISDGVWVCQRCQKTVRRVVPAQPAAADLPPCAVLTDWRDRYPPLAGLRPARQFLECFHVFTTSGRVAACTKCAYTCPIIPDEEATA